MYKQIAAFLISSLVVTSAHAETVWVQVKKSAVRSSPEYFAPAVRSVGYGDSLTTAGGKDGWYKVKFSGGEGYIPESAVTVKQVVLTSRGASKLSADSSDVVLAGKGFSKEIEAQYKGRDSGARYDLVDKVEQISNVSEKEVAQFAKSGGLKG